MSETVEPIQTKGIKIKRYITKEGIHPYEEIKWGTFTALIQDFQTGKIKFEQKDVEFPKMYSQRAINIISSKYFKGQLGAEDREWEHHSILNFEPSPKREWSYKQLLDRVVATNVRWGIEQEYFETEKDAEIFSDELTHILLHQKAYFNSPVWFNMGFPNRPQTASACFINSIEDNMESILEFIKTEGLIFRAGSGSGVNISTLRSKYEGLSTGGESSGALSFMKVFDSNAGSIKSGGATRRAAKIIIMNVDHPEIIDFITCKVKEEEKAFALIREGYDSNYNGEAYSTVAFQNGNNSVRVTDEFMRAVKKDKDFYTQFVNSKRKHKKYSAKLILEAIAEATWRSGDPGIQFHDTINKWNTVSNTDELTSSNPCSEYLSVSDTSCNLASLNIMKFFDMENAEFLVDDYISACQTMATAMDIWIDKATYPTERISKETREHRTIGLGYANLGSLIMALGYPYDSDEGRSVAAAITSLLSAAAYEVSARNCETLPPFPKWEENKEPMKKVLEMHLEKHKEIPQIPYIKDVFKKAQTLWETAIKVGSKQGYRNSYVSNSAPTGCVSGETIVYTEQGMRRMIDIYKENPFFQYRSLNIKVHSNPSLKLASHFYSNGLAETIKITDSLGRVFEATKNHQIKIIDNNGDYVWRKMEEIKNGDVLPVALYGSCKNIPYISLSPTEYPSYKTENKTFQEPSFINEKFAEFLGIYYGDGRTKPRSIGITISNQDKDFMVNYLDKLMWDLFKIKKSGYIEKFEGCIEVYYNSKRLINFLEKNNIKKENSSNIFVPEQILKSKESVQAAFIRGFFETDGSVHSSITATSISESFIRDTNAILNAMGILSSIDDSKNWENKGHLGSNPVFRISIHHSKFMKIYRDKIGFISDRKNSILNNMGFKSRKSGFPKEIINIFAKKVREKKRTAIRVGHSVLIRTKKYIKENFNKFHFSKVKKIEPSSCYTFDLSVPDGNSYIANGLVSHNTIGLAMDCDTLGCEPELALVKFKKLAGSDVDIRMVNTTTPISLRRLGYDTKTIKKITKYIEIHNKIEGCEDLREEHLPIFDTSLSTGGGRTIDYMGHLNMLGAIQPFFSGGISKTINMPEESTVDDIYKAYLTAWELGIKCVAIYRDGSKGSQPLSTIKEKRTRATRVKLPDDASGKRHKFTINGMDVYLHTGVYEDGTLGEIFILTSKQGSTLQGLMDAFATNISMLLQYGVPLFKIIDKHLHTKFEPHGFTSNDKIPMTSSIIDYIMRYLAINYLLKEDCKVLGINGHGKKAEKDNTDNKKNEGQTIQKNRIDNQKQIDGSTCSECGAIMEKNGSCRICINCGISSGCS